MKALSIRQPWAWAILHAGKDVENRSWRPNGANMRAARTLQNDHILLHAARGMTRTEHEAFCDTYAEIRARTSVHLPSTPTFDELKTVRGGIVARARLVGIVIDSMRPQDYTTRLELARARESLWYFGPVGLVLGEVKPLPFTPCQGALGFFDVPGHG